MLITRKLHLILYICVASSLVFHTSICHISERLAQHPIGEHDVLAVWARDYAQENEIDDLDCNGSGVLGIVCVCVSFCDSGEW